MIFIYLLFSSTVIQPPTLTSQHTYNIKWSVECMRVGYWKCWTDQIIDFQLFFETHILSQCSTAGQTQFTEIREWIFPRAQILKNIWHEKVVTVLLTKNELTSNLKFLFAFSVYLIEYESTPDPMSWQWWLYLEARLQDIVGIIASIVSLCWRVAARQPVRHTV